jgi:hypothetical protein
MEELWHDYSEYNEYAVDHRFVQCGDVKTSQRQQ